MAERSWAKGGHRGLLSLWVGMVQILQVLALVSVVGALALGGGGAYAQGRPHRAVALVLLMDSSGSMRHTDPDRLRVPAAKMLMALLSSSDQVGLVSFSSKGYPVLHLTPAGLAHKEQLFAAADKVSSKGVFTNLYAALAEGDLMLQTEAPAGMRKILVLMSDGRMDVGSKARDRILTRRLTNQLLANLKRDHIAVYSIAFTAASDTALLKTIATRTGGLFQLAHNDRDLQQVFSTIFESTAHPEMLPLHGGKFLVDSAVKEVTIVASKASKTTKIALRAPDGRELTAAGAGSRVRWFVSDAFDMITLPKPMAGSWQILASKGGDKAYVVTNLRLKTNLLGGVIAPGGSVLVKAWLARGHTVIKTAQLLANTHFLVENVRPDGTVSKVMLRDSGDHDEKVAHDAVFSRQLRLWEPGLHKLRVIAKSATFEREQNVVFEVDPVNHQAHTVAAQPSMPSPPGKTAPVASSKPVEHAVSPASKPKPHPHAVKANATKVPVHAKKSAAKPGAPAPHPTKGHRLARIVMGFMLINALLLAALVGIAWWRKRSPKNSSAGSGESDDGAG